jgi:hypothetical protein
MRMAAFAIAMWPALALAGEPPLACDPKEAHVVCSLKVERNNAMDDLAISDGALRDQREADEKTAEFWKEYAAGLPAGPELKLHVESVCSFKGAQSEPVAQLCKWWDDNYVPHPVKGKSK